MPRDYAAMPVSTVRRSDRELTDVEIIKQILHRAPIGVLATVHEGQPFINSNLYVYDESAHCIYMHTAKVGRTRANVELEERVCFSVTEMGRLLPADEALEFSVEYAGVAIFRASACSHGSGRSYSRFANITGQVLPHLQSGIDYRPIAPEELARTSVYRIDIEEWSGKRKQVTDDFPGAFYYGEPPKQP
ncbi:MAG: pyridoxamine 5'-phosphate oxidase family protein [Anaerolineae bacterium]